GMQPLSDAFLLPDQTENEFLYNLSVGLCGDCKLVQHTGQIDRSRMFHEGYPYYSSGSAVMRKHFQETARSFLDQELTGDDPFIVELGCNDGGMRRCMAEAGVRHVGIEPSSGVAEVAKRSGVQVSTEFFDEASAVRIREARGRADVIFAANTVCHIPYID